MKIRNIASTFVFSQFQITMLKSFSNLIIRFYNRRFSTGIGRYLQDKGRNGTDTLVSRPVAGRENGFIHSTLEKLPAYEHHIIPHPRSLLSAKSSGSHSTVRSYLNKELSSASKVSTLNILNDNATGLKLNIPVLGTNVFVESFKRRSLLKSSKEKDLEDLKQIGKLFLEAKYLSDEEFIQVMLYSCLWSVNPPFKNFLTLKRWFDFECCKRYVTWPIEKQLLVADVWFHYSAGHVPKYFELLVKNVQNNLKNLTTPQLIHTLFLVNLNRKADPVFMQQVEQILEETMNNFSNIELLVVALSFFKTSTTIKGDIIIRIMIEHLLKGLNHVEPVVLTGIVKTLRYSIRYENKELIKLLLSRASRYRIWKGENLPVATHLCLLAVSHDVFVPTLIDKVINDMSKSNHVRLKDLSMLLSTANKFNYFKEGVLEYFKHELSNPVREKEILLFSNQYLNGLLYLAYKEVFIQEGIHRALSESFFKTLKGNAYAGFELSLATLDCLVEIDNPTYKGNRLDDRYRTDVFKKEQIFYSGNNKETFREMVFIDIWTILKDTVKSPVSFVHVLPYVVDPVFLLIFDEIGRSHKPPTDFLNRISARQFAKPTDDRVWLVIWPLTKKDVWSETELKGFTLVKERHYTKLGFELLKINLVVNSTLPKIRVFLQENLKCYLPKNLT